MSAGIYENMKYNLKIVYCPRCGWLLRAAYFAQEFLTSFEENLESVALMPGSENGSFRIFIENDLVYDRKSYGGFPEMKQLKQLIRDRIAPGKSLGHADRKSEPPIG
jgi:selenoprotein W-related protein